MTVGWRSGFGVSESVLSVMPAGPFYRCGMSEVSGTTSGTRLTDRVSIGVLTRTVPRFVVDEVLVATGAREKRSRLLPAHVVVYFVMALALFRDGYDEVIRSLVHGLQLSRTWSSRWQVPSTAALSQARTRLGEAPIRELFQRVAVPLSSPATPGAWFPNDMSEGRQRRWRLMAIDGVMLDIPDTPANLTVYEKAVGGTRRPYPQVKIVGLGECGSHAILDAGIGSIRDGERALAEPLVRSIDESMLVTADRGFYSYDLWRTYLLSGAALLWRVTRTLPLPVLRSLPDGSYLSEVAAPGVRGGKTRMDFGRVEARFATHIPVRVVEYHVRHRDDPENTGPGDAVRLITTILDPANTTAPELAAAYAQRWEIESSFRELETQLLASGSTLRSRTPELIRQEIWGLFLTHYAIRAFMVDAADTIDVDPDRLSTIRAINIVRRSVTDQAGLSPLRAHPRRSGTT